MAGDSTMSGLICSKAEVPTIPTTAENMKPGFDLSTKYHSTGFTSARVKETCRVDCQGNFLCKIMFSTAKMKGSKTHDCEGDPNEGTDTPYYRCPVSNGA